VPSRIHALTADVFKALAHPLRLALLEFLNENERCVCEIVGTLGLRQPTVSKHLAILHTQGLISRRRDGSRVVYQLAPGAADLLAAGLAFTRDRRQAEARSLLSAVTLPEEPGEP